MKDFLTKMDVREANILFLFFLSLLVLFLIIRKRLRKNSPPYLKLISLYILLIALQIGFSHYYVFTNAILRGKKDPINISAYIFMIFEYSIFAVLLAVFIKLRTIKKYLILSTFILTSFFIIIWYSSLSFIKTISISTTIESICLVPFCLYYFFELLKNPPFSKLNDEPSFWIVTGILFLFIFITPLYLTYDYFKQIPQMQILDYLGYDLIVLFLAKASFIKTKQTNG